MFCRVEGIPRDDVLPMLRQIVDWETPAGYLDHLDDLALGPNVVSLLGHSAVRAHVMGFGRSVADDVEPTASELATMRSMIDRALDDGYLGLSINTLPWDKLDGTRYRSRPTPSVFATWKEYRALVEPVRRRDAVFQAVPNIQTRWNIALFMGLASKIRHQPLPRGAHARLPRPRAPRPPQRRRRPRRPRQRPPGLGRPRGGADLGKTAGYGRLLRGTY